MAEFRDTAPLISALYRFCFSKKLSLASLVLSGTLFVLCSVIEAKKWANVKIVNQVGTRVKIKANKILPTAVLSSGEIFVYHRFLNGKDRKAKITLKAMDEYTDKPLTINGVAKFTVRPTTYDDTQKAYVYRSGGCDICVLTGLLTKRDLSKGSRIFFSNNRKLPFLSPTALMSPPLIATTPPESPNMSPL